ncbi:MAG TPA: energy transducer TonB [Pyrinomonadaceae bacterium]|jgi:TonB family protein|nr:energy transducer TonB [Pyrinomonadaceae bacterium]
MLKSTGLICSSAFLLMALNLSATAQNNPASTPNSFQPAKASAPASPAPADTDRVRDGLLGPVRRVRTETAKLLNKNGALAEQSRVLLEVAAYDLKGTKIENAYFPVNGETLTGKEVYKYDEKGNISEMTLQGADGSLLSKETYTYEYDMLGNWIRMSTSVAVVAGGKLSFEPVEITYRTITYYLDENMAKMVQPATTPAANITGPANVNADGSKANAQPATLPSATSNSKASGAVKNPVALLLPAVMSLDKSKLMSGTEGVKAPLNTSGTSSSSPAVSMSAEPPASPTPKPLLKPISGGVLNGKAINLPKPVLPEAARRIRSNDVINVEVIIDETGKVISARALSGNMMLRDACVQAAQRARFSPTKISGQPVKVSGNITYTFNLSQ